MSNFRAMATVTAALRLEKVQKPAENALSKAVLTTTTRPDNTGNSPSDARVNIFLYQVTPNAAWRNRDLPTRNDRGELTQRPRLALDLHYLLTFYGDEIRLEPQRMLGNVALEMHAKPLLTRKNIQDTLASTDYDFLVESNLADEIELVKFTPLLLSLEELSKMWSVLFQTPYALSVAYEATVVLIEAEEKPRTPLPVLEREFFVVPFRHPIIERIRSEAGERKPILSDSTIVIEGKQLRGEVTKLRIGGGVSDELPNVTDTQIVFPLSSLQPAGALRAGVQAVQIIQPMKMGRPRAEHLGIESNVAPMVLRPTITNITVPNSGTITIELDPLLSKAQRVLLLLNDADNPAASGLTFISDRRSSYQITDRTLALLQADGVPQAVLDSLSEIKDQEYMREVEFIDAVKGKIGEPETETYGALILKYAGPEAVDRSITFRIAGTAAGDYLLRIQVDGAESVLQVDEDESSPTYGQILGPKVTIP
jgi:hypothetical protein